jgi:hypothetical protein
MKSITYALDGIYMPLGPIKMGRILEKIIMIVSMNSLGHGIEKLHF